MSGYGVDDVHEGWEPRWTHVVVSEGKRPIQVTVGWVANLGDSFPIAMVGRRASLKETRLREFNRNATNAAQAAAKDAIRRGRYHRRKMEEEKQKRRVKPV